MSKNIKVMCKIQKNIDVKKIKQHLIQIADDLVSEGQVKATLVDDNGYSSMTAVVEKECVICINWMSLRKEEAVC